MLFGGALPSQFALLFWGAFYVGISRTQYRRKSLSPRVSAAPVNLAVLLLSMRSMGQRQWFQGLLCSIQDNRVTSQTWSLLHGALWSLKHEDPRCWHPQITEWPQICHHLDYSDVAQQRHVCLIQLSLLSCDLNATIKQGAYGYIRHIMVFRFEQIVCLASKTQVFGRHIRQCFI